MLLGPDEGSGVGVVGRHEPINGLPHLACAYITARTAGISPTLKEDANNQKPNGKSRNKGRQTWD